MAGNVCTVPPPEAQGSLQKRAWLARRSRRHADIAGQLHMTAHLDLSESSQAKFWHRQELGMEFLAVELLAIVNCWETVCGFSREHSSSHPVQDVLNPHIK